MGKHGKPTTTTGRRYLHSGRPWQVIAIDLVGPMPKTARANSWILVLYDHFTQWQDAIAIRDAIAPTVARTLDERVFSYFGLPETIHTDQGALFESDLLASLCSVANFTILSVFLRVFSSCDLRLRCCVLSMKFTIFIL